MDSNAPAPKKQTGLKTLTGPKIQTIHGTGGKAMPRVTAIERLSFIEKTPPTICIVLDAQREST